MITGSIVAIVTPMQEDGSLDLPRFRSLIDFHIQEGTDGIVVVGTTGESPTVNVEEHCELIRVAVEHSAGRIPVIAGTGANSTSEAIELTEFSRKAGAVAGLSVVPYYNRPTQEGMYRHFRTIAEASPLPMILYNVPGRTVADNFYLQLMLMLKYATKNSDVLGGCWQYTPQTAVTKAETGVKRVIIATSAANWASMRWVSASSVVMALPMIITTAVSVAPRQRTADTMRPSISTTASMALTMELLARFCAHPAMISMAIINPLNAPHNLRDTRMLSSCMALPSETPKP